jgi:hypothetical protein
MNRKAIGQPPAPVQLQHHRMGKISPRKSPESVGDNLSTRPWLVSLGKNFKERRAEQSTGEQINGEMRCERGKLRCSKFFSECVRMIALSFIRPA